jgi:flap endonuclease-1
MGVQITEILPRKQIDYPALSGKTIAVDAHLALYQFITTIRQPDGTPLMDSTGNVTSHLMGIFTRSSNLMQKGIKLAYVFDGKPPELKRKTIEERKQGKIEAMKKYEHASELGDELLMHKYAGRTARLTKEMIEESKELLSGLGIPIIQAPSEGEAEASYIVKKGDAFAVGSQDADSLLFGAPLLIRNLNVSARRKIAGTLAYEQVFPEKIELSEVLSALSITQSQLIAMSMLVGTDFNPRGIKGIGPKNAIKLVKKHKEDFSGLFTEVKWNESFEMPWEDVFEVISKMPVSDDYSLECRQIEQDKIREILCEKHQFSRERVEKTLAELEKECGKKAQKGLSDFF